MIIVLVSVLLVPQGALMPSRPRRDPVSAALFQITLILNNNQDVFSSSFFNIGLVTIHFDRFGLPNTLLNNLVEILRELMIYY